MIFPLILGLHSRNKTEIEKEDIQWAHQKIKNEKAYYINEESIERAVNTLQTKA
jgi:hypothetical protein